ncbi:MAG: YggS family pyridoxal phosphate enzyme [Acidobacteria bacterium]|nr:YggS family pyridoxal phosphate enzyme [Acidobacteriota bacterium]
MGVETSSIAAHVEVIFERILRAAQRSGRKPEEITLVAVAKMFPAESICAAYAAGVRHFGENRVQEWEAKRPLLADVDATWHLVGHLQSNKAARAVRLFHCVDSLDSIALAQKLDHAMASLCSGGLNLSRTPSREPATDGALKRTATGTGGKSAPAIGEGAAHRLPVLIEVHLGDEPSKTGVTEADLPALAEAALALPHLDLRGLMCVPPYFEDPEHVRPYFRRLRELRDTLRRRLANSSACPSEASDSAQGKLREESLLPELSMGMSHDFEVAIEEGATQVRLGTAIFGSRARP